METVCFSETVKSVLRKNDSDINNLTTGGRSLCTCHPGAHSQEIIPLIFNSHFFVVYFPGDCMDNCGAELEELKNAL
jgi:hypothetical protein